MSDAELNADSPGDIDGQHPWLGLDSFTEQTRAYFFGRDEEVAELARRIQRKTLTVLFGQSGLGKTSILRAGLVPRLRPQGYCPVYVRISYAGDAPSPADQIKQAILRATTAQGHWSRAGVSQAGETLWEFLHHRDDNLRDEAGAPLIPLLIFDQFEEIFTLAQTDDDGKRRVARFVAELADLVENRPPPALEARVELDDTLSEQFDFARNDYRVLISLREDYLANLEGLRTAMPSITQNRMRLARMSGSQALAAVMQPGGRLVSEEVAQAIVRFIAGGAELANAEVEPSLLSLICRELNNQRIVQKRAEISTDLLAGSHAGILAEFYERVLRDMPEGVHRVIEDDLLTEAGYRENLAEERVRKAFAAAGAAPDALALLVNRRLLRVEERLDARRVELTHDVLCGVVLAARAQRQERQAREAAGRQLQQQALEQRRIRQALLRARQIATGCVALAALAVAGGVYGYVKARDAEKTRGEAEALVGYLLNDFYVRLQPEGKVDLIGDLVDRASGYYTRLPPGMRNADTERHRAMTLLRQGQVLTGKGQYKAAKAPLDEAIAVLSGTAGNGDIAAQSLPELTEALSARSYASWVDGQSDDAMRMAAQAVAGLRQAAAASNASRAILLQYARALRGLGFYQSRTGAINASLENLRAAQRALAYAAHGDQDLGATLEYVRTTTILHEVLARFTSRHDEAAASGAETLTLIEHVLKRAPANYSLIEMKGRLLGDIGYAELQYRRPGQAITTMRQGQSVEEELRRLDPSQSGATAEISIDHEMLARAYRQLGQVDESQNQTLQAYGMFATEAPSVYQSGNLIYTAIDLAALKAEMGERDGVGDAERRANQYTQANIRNLGARSPARVLARFPMELMVADDARVLGDESTSLDRCATLIFQVENLPSDAKADSDFADIEHSAFLLDAQVAYAHGEHERAAASAARSRQADARSAESVSAPDPHPLILQALALARLNRAAEAQALIVPLIREERRQIASGADDQFLRVELASSLLASALSDPGTRKASLKEASQLLDALPATLQSFSTVRLWRARIQEAQAGHG